MLRLPVENSIEKRLDICFMGILFPCCIQFLNYVFENLRCAILSSKNSFKKSLGPNNAVDQFLGALPDRAHWETFLFDTISTLVALSEAFANSRASCLISISPCLNQRNAKIETDGVDELASFIVVERVNHQVKRAEECVPESIFLDATNVIVNGNERVLRTDRLLESLALWHIDMVPSEQELSVQVADVNRVQINDSKFGETSHRQNFDKFAPNATCTHN